YVRDVEVAGSNPVSPTNQTRHHAETASGRFFRACKPRSAPRRTGGPRAIRPRRAGGWTLGDAAPRRKTPTPGRVYRRLRRDGAGTTLDPTPAARPCG